MKRIVTTQKNFESGVYLCLVFITLLFNGLLLIPSTSNADAVEMSSSALASHYQSAEAKWKAHKWEEALSEYDIVAKSKSPYASKAHIQIGKYYKYHGLWDAAIEHYEEAISKALIVRDLEDAETSIAAVHLSKGDYKTAIDMFTDIISKTQDWEQVKYCTYWIKELRRRLSYGDGACNTCGQNALMELLKLKGIKVLKSDIEKGLKLSEDGASMEAMKQYAMTKGLKVNGVKLTLEELKNADMPLIALIDNPKHYIIVTKVAPNDIHVINPEIGLEPFSIPNKEFKKIWKGQALIFTDKNLEGEIALLSSNEMKALSGKVCFCCPAGNNGGPGQLPNTPFFPDPNSPGGSPPPGGCQPPGMPAISVNMANMNFLVQDTDLAYNGRGPGIKIQRTYNADSGLNGPFGKGWTFNYNVSLVENPGGSIDVTRETGTIHRFNSAGGGNYIPPKAIHDTLTKNGDGTYALRLKGSRHIQAFSATGRLTSITDRNGNSVTFQYNPDNSLASITDAVGRITTFNYGTNGKISSITDPQQRSVSFIYDAGDNLTSSTDMAGTTVSYSYDSNSYMTGITSPKGTTTIGYTTEFGAKWVSSILDPLGHTRSFQDIWPSGTSTTDANGNAVTYKSNGDAFAVTITDALGNTVNYGYDGDGNRNSIQDPNGHTTLLVYDARGNVTSITDPLTHSVQMIYDGNDNLTQLTDPALNTYIYEYDSHNNLTHITDPENGPTKKTILAYNSYGEVTTFTDPKGNPLTYIHDNQGNLTSATSPINGSDSYTYDAIGRALTHTDPKTNTTSYTYDGIDRVTEVRYQDQSIKSYTYDCCGPHNVTDQSGTLTFIHDNINRLIGFTDAHDKTIGYGHDFARNITSITYPDGKVVNYQYDEANRLTQVTDWLNNVTSYDYDQAGNLIATILPDDSIVLYDYDDSNRLTSIFDFKADGTIISSFEYTPDSRGNRTPISSYQPLMAIPKPQSLSYSHDAENSLLTVGNKTFYYDNNGNMTQKTIGSSLTTFLWNFDNMLTELSSGNRLFDFRYDGVGGRIAKIEGPAEKRYIVDGGITYAETDASGTITAYYVYGLGLISKITPTNQAYYYHYDGLGSTIAMTDSTGAIINKYAYDEFGKILKSEETISNPFKYVGAYGVMDDGNGLYYMRARYYDPRIGRFISKDPIGLDGGLNLYEYVLNNPLNYTDPHGEYPLWVVVPAWGLLVTTVAEIIHSFFHPVLPEQPPHLEPEPANPGDPRKWRPTDRIPPPKKPNLPKPTRCPGGK